MNPSSTPSSTPTRLARPPLVPGWRPFKAVVSEALTWARRSGASLTLFDNINHRPSYHAGYYAAVYDMINVFEHNYEEGDDDLDLRWFYAVCNMVLGALETIVERQGLVGGASLGGNS